MMKKALDVEAVRSWIGKHGGVYGYPEGNYAGWPAKLLENECDILIPAAMEGVINMVNAGTSRRR